MKAILITHKVGFWAYDSLFAIKGLELFFNSSLGLDQSFNAHKLTDIAYADVLIIGSHTLRYAYSRGLELNELVGKLRKHASKIVLMDGWDSFQLSITPEEIEAFDVVIKTNGIYKDRDLYNYEVGCDYPTGNWSFKSIRKQVSYSKVHLDKIKLGYPCLIGVVPEVRHRLRKTTSPAGLFDIYSKSVIDKLYTMIIPLLKQLVPKKKSVYFLGDLGHYQRYELLKMVQDAGFLGDFGVFRVLERLSGLENWRDRPDSAKISSKVASEIEDIGLLKNRKTRLIYNLNMLKHLVQLSPTGYGEMCFRHGEIMASGGIGIIQDISNVDHLSPLRADHNYVSIKPDLSNAIETISDVMAKPDDYDHIGVNAMNDWRKFQNEVDSLLRKTVIDYL